MSNTCMKTTTLILFLLLVSTEHTLQAQVFRRGGRITARQLIRERRASSPSLPAFKPAVYFSLGYSLPNLDKSQLPQLVGLSRGNISQLGPLTGSLDYRFSRTMGIGVLVSYGRVKAPYADFSQAVVVNGELSSWSFMLNFMRYIPVPNEKVIPYFRTAIGINSWQQQYTDAAGNPVTVTYSPEELAYQAGFGARFQLSKNTGCFIEAGYGKYILSGGVAVRL